MMWRGAPCHRDYAVQPSRPCGTHTLYLHACTYDVPHTGFSEPYYFSEKLWEPYQAACVPWHWVGHLYGGASQWPQHGALAGPQDAPLDAPECRADAMHGALHGTDAIPPVVQPSKWLHHQTDMAWGASGWLGAHILRCWQGIGVRRVRMADVGRSLPTTRCCADVGRSPSMHVRMWDDPCHRMADVGQSLA